MIKKCLTCGKEFIAQPYKYKAKYCCRGCNGGRVKTGKMYPCNFCGKDVYTPIHKQNNKLHFCSKKCNTDYKKKDNSSIDCLNCGGKVKTHKSSNRKYCSPQCSHKDRPKNGKIYPCDYCGKEFYRGPSEGPKHSKHFCSKECHFNYMRENKDYRFRPKNGKNIKCLNCGNLFHTISSMVDKRKCCSRKCDSKYRHKKSLIEKICPYCKKSFTTKKGTNCKYCSNECKHLGRRTRIKLTCIQCGKEFSKAPSEIRIRQCCSQKCTNKYYIGEKHWCWVKDRSKIKVSKIMKNIELRSKWRDIICSTYKYKCQICGSTCNKFGKYKVNAHHIYRVSKWPLMLLSISNGVPLCQLCHKMINGKEDEWIDYFADKAVA